MIGTMLGMACEPGSRITEADRDNLLQCAVLLARRYGLSNF